MQEKHPELFTTSDLDPRKRDRVVPMKVLSLGMPRTGTACMIFLTNMVRAFKIADPALSNAARSEYPRLSMLPRSYHDRQYP